MTCQGSFTRFLFIVLCGELSTTYLVPRSYRVTGTEMKGPCNRLGVEGSGTREVDYLPRGGVPTTFALAVTVL